MFSIVVVGAAYAQGCSNPGLDPAEACPVGTVYNPENGSCDAVTA